MPKHTKQLSPQTLKLMKRLWREHVKSYVPKLLIAICFMALTAIMTAALAKLLEPVLDDVFISKDMAKLQEIALLVLLTFFLKGVGSYGESVAMSYIGHRIVADIQFRLFSHLTRLDLAFFHNHSTGSLISCCTNDVGLMRHTVSSAFTGLGKDFLSVVALVSVMFYQDWLLALIAFFVFPIAILPIVRIGKRMRKVSKSTQVEIGEFTSLLNQVFQGIRVVKAYGMEKYEQSRAKTTIEKLLTLIFKASRTRAISHPVMETLGGIAIVVIILYGGYQVIQGIRTAGAFFSFIAALLLAYEPIKRLANLNVNIQEGLGAASRVFDILDIEPSIQDQPQATEVLHLKGHIEFKDVAFAYPSGRTALKNLSFVVPAGKKTAFVGASGAGKSTLLNLIPRFYDVSKGEILIDALNIQIMTLASLRKNIALVSQEITLFDDTIYANIAYGRPEASRAEIIQAAKDAAVHSFVESLPEGYETQVGESGVKLSGGQRQRIAIARAMLKNAPILLLDEATSALDTESERLVQDALNKLMTNRTSLVIAHRLSTIQDADLIYVLDEGMVKEAGTHEELIRQKGIYQKLCLLQKTTHHSRG